ncbi:MAG: DUF4242 domain-containing protein [Chitinophagales bacterium]
MKRFYLAALFVTWGFTFPSLYAQQGNSHSEGIKSYDATDNKSGNHLYLDVHHIGPGKITLADVAGAHAKDLATEGKFGVHFIKYWVDTLSGTVYCLASAKDSASLVQTHAAAHGLLPEHVYRVSPGQEASMQGGKNLYLDVHELGAGNVKAADVAEAHKKDLAVEGKYGVNLINYWVNEKEGVIMCLAEAPNADALIKTHKEAHGLLPKYVTEVKQGQ